jgi:hypothetical protein
LCGACTNEFSFYIFPYNKKLTTDSHIYLTMRSFQLKKPLDNFSKIKNHIIFYTIFYSFSTKENPYLKIYLNGFFNVKLLFDDGLMI